MKDLFVKIIGYSLGVVLAFIGILLMIVPGINVIIGVIIIVVFIFEFFKNNNESTPSSYTDNKVTELTKPSLETNFKTNSNKEQVYNNIEVSVAGVTYYNRQEIIKKLNKNSIIELRREYNNQFDKNAIAVYANSNQIGYIPKEIAVNLAKRIDGGEKLIASILAIIGGGSYNYGVKLLLKTFKKDESYNENVTNSYNYDEGIDDDIDDDYDYTNWTVEDLDEYFGGEDNWPDYD